MFFTNVNQNNQFLTKKDNFQFLQLRQNNNNTRNPEIINKNKEIPILKETKKMEWGEPTWFFFHTIAEKVKEEEFHKIRKDLLNIIYTICSNLPCPICSTHAKKHLNSSNFNNIQSKQQLKDFFFNFHNIVNQKKNYLLFDYQNLNEKYSKAITLNIIRNFIEHFRNKNHSNLMIADDFHRKRSLRDVEIWVQNNIQYFNK